MRLLKTNFLKEQTFIEYKNVNVHKYELTCFLAYYLKCYMRPAIES